MRVAGGAIGPDDVLLWTGERELTRLSRDGRRSSWTVPMPHLTSHIGPAGVRLIDHLGTMHRYSLEGVHEGASELDFAVEGPITAAALAAGIDRWVIIDDPPRDEPAALAIVVDSGKKLDWNTPSRDGYAEIDAALSQDGNWLMLLFDTFYYFTGLTSGGPGPGAGASVIDIAGTERFSHHSREHFEAAAMSPAGDAVVWWGRWAGHLDVYVDDASGEWSLHGFSKALHVAFDDTRVALLLEGPPTLVVAELATRRQAVLELPEQLTQIVFCGEHVVLFHPELPAWWIPIATLRFEEAG